MSNIRKFYYLPHNSSANFDDDFTVQTESLWKIGGAKSLCLDSNELTNGRKDICFNDLPEKVKNRQLQLKKILGNLNKMTTKKFHRLIVNMISDGADENFVQMLAEVIFSKVLVDDIYVQLYANFCNEMLSCLTDDLSSQFSSVLNQHCRDGCQHLLRLSDADIDAIHEDYRFVYKKKFMTLMRFIVELSNLSYTFYDGADINPLIQQLINKGEEVHLEAVYYILFTCTLRCNNYIWDEDLWLLVARLSKGTGTKGQSVSSRIRFMYLTLVESKIGVIPHGVNLNLQSQSPTTSDSENNEQGGMDLKGF